MTDRVGKFREPLSNGLCDKQLAFGNLQLAILTQGVAIGLKYIGPSARQIVSINHYKIQLPIPNVIEPIYWITGHTTLARVEHFISNQFL